jgi:hypothetical protein
MIAAQTGAPFVEVTVGGAEMSQTTDEVVKNQNAYIRDIASMKEDDLPAFANFQLDLDDGYTGLEQGIEAWSRALANVCPASARNHNG